ncbi:MAG: FecR family protein [Campylobacterales bacterium]
MSRLEYISVDEVAAAWFIEEQNGFSDCRKNEFENWLAQSCEHVKSYREIKATWGQLDDLSFIGSAKTEYKSANNALFKRISYGAAILSACILIIIAGYLLPYYKKHIENPVGIISQYTLADGSLVGVDTNTSLDVNYYLGSRQLRLLYGQITIDAYKDKDRPMHIFVGNVKITVTGTMFGVRSVGEGVHVAVREGSVKVYLTNPNGDIMLSSMTAGQHILVRQDGSYLLTKRNENMCEWANGRLAFDSKRLKDVVKELSRYGIDNLDVDRKLGDSRVSGSFEIAKAQKFIEMLPKVLPAKVEQRNNKIFVRHIDSSN